MMFWKSSNNMIEYDDLSSDDEEEEADKFGMEDGGFCCFTNSLPIVYLRLAKCQGCHHRLNKFGKFLQMFN
jgi:hypothetical protein